MPQTLPIGEIGGARRKGGVSPGLQVRRLGIPLRRSGGGAPEPQVTMPSSLALAKISIRTALCFSVGIFEGIC